MLGWTIQISIISIIFIFLVHNLISFFKSTLTVPKIRDLVNSPNKKYQSIFDTISNSNNNYNDYHDNNSISYTSVDLLPTQSESDSEPSKMKDELKSFLKKQLNTESSENNIIPIHFDNNYSNL